MSTAHLASPPTHVVGSTVRPSTTKALLVCGIVSSALYVAMNVIGALGWPGYSSTSQTVSELFAIGAPSRPLLLPLGLAYDVLLVAFGLGVWRCAGRAGRLRVTAGLLIAVGALGAVWPPMHLRGTTSSLTDTLHVAFAGVVVVSNLLAIGFGASAFGQRFRLYSIVTVVILLGFGTLTALDGPRIAANLPTPWIGLYERINIAGYLAWIAVMAGALLRSHGDGETP
jgi:hypothetical protein